MTLRQKQSTFAKNVPLLVSYIYALGYETTYGDTWAFNLWPIIDFLEKLPTNKIVTSIIKLLKQRAHSRNSYHYKRLAIDLNLFKDGKYLRNTKDHLPFGLFWESLGGSWGGRYNDGNHYSWGENKNLKEIVKN
jgi:hypothetical protein